MLPHRRKLFARSGHLAGPLAFLTLLAGCSSTPDDAPPAQPLRFAALVAPRVGPDPERPPERPTAEEVLLEVVTSLSIESDPVSYTHLTLPTNREV